MKDIFNPGLFDPRINEGKESLFWHQGAVLIFSR